jgi:hypothetical protein
MEHGQCSSIMMIHYYAAQPNVLAKIKIWSLPNMTVRYTTFTCSLSPNITAKSYGNCSATSTHMKGNHWPGHVCPHVKMFHQTDFCEILYLGFLLNLDKITDTWHEGLHQFMWLIFITEMVCVLCEVHTRFRKHLTIETYCLLWNNCMK